MSNTISVLVHALFSAAIAFIVAFILDLFFSNLLSTKHVKIATTSTKKVSNYKSSSNKSSKKALYDGNRGKKY
ncbi:hypothetical protein C1645_762462, partial [Glomus cerebriforme]